MILDAREFVSPEYGRTGSMKAVINHALDKIETGNHIHVEGMKDAIGKTVPWKRLSAYVTMLRGERKFTIRRAINGNGYEIHRIA